MYVRAMSRVLVDQMTTAWNHDKNPAEVIHLMAAGSTSITSDYDVSMAGPGVSLLAYQINDTFRRDTGQDLAIYADTNLYTTPWVSLTKERADFFGTQNIRHLMDYGTGTGMAMYLPIPTVDNGGLETVFRAAVYRLSRSLSPGFVDPDFVPDDGDTLYSLAATFEDFMYRQQEQLDWRRFWKILTQAQIASPDAYFSVATILVVVVEMQMQKESPLGFAREIYLASAIENLAEIQEKGLLSPDPSEEAIVATVKYVYRTLYSLNRNTPKDKDLKKSLQIARVADKGRGMLGYQTSPGFQKYRKALPAILGFLSKNLLAPTFGLSDRNSY
jgi:hypothetical protein